MANAFLEVFPTLQLNHEMKGLLSEATVTKVASNRSRDFIRVYFDNTRLIPKRGINQISLHCFFQLRSVLSYHMVL